MGKKNPSSRMNRGFSRIVSFIKVGAIIRSHHRKLDEQGNIIAETDDYGTVRELINDLYIDTTGAPDAVRSLIEAVGKFTQQSESVSQSRLATYLNINQMAGSRLAKKAIKEGWLLNQE